MKTLKSFSLFVAFALLLTSCIVNSLHPFYTKDVLYYEPNFEGNWVDQDNGIWNVKPFQEVFNELKEDLDKKSFDQYNKYNNISYVVNYEKDSAKSQFLVVPFKINNQLFLDFSPANDNESLNCVNSLYGNHLIPSHSLVKLDMDSKENFSLRWLDSDKLEALLKENKIKIKHEKIGIDDDVVLTASSEELVKFIEKYMASDNEDKWKTRTEANLKKI